MNSIGIVTGKKLLDCPDNLMELTMKVNTNAHFWTTKAVLPEMLKRNSGISQNNTQNNANWLNTYEVIL